MSPHNPILEERQLPRGPLAGAPPIRPGTVGLLLRNGLLQRALRPGEQLSMAERLSGGTLVVIDTKPHEGVLELDLLDRTGKYSFPVRIELEYRVAAPERLLQPRVSDTEQLVGKRLEPALRLAARAWSLLELDKLLVDLEQAVSPLLFADLGLELLRHSVSVRESDERFRASRLYLDGLMRPRSLTLDVAAPDRSRQYSFPLRIRLEYQAHGLEQALKEEQGDEALIRAQLEPLVRREARTKLLDDYDALVADLQDAPYGGAVEAAGFKYRRHNVELRDDDQLFRSQIAELRERMRPRSFNRDYSELDAGGKTRFPLRISFAYKPLDRDAALEPPESAEQLIDQILAPIVTRICRGKAIDDHSQVTQAIEDAITPLLLRSLKAELIGAPRAEIRTDDAEFQARLKQLLDLQRLNRTPQHRTHHTQIPSSDMLANFAAEVHVTYRLTLNKLPTDSPAEAEQMLWPRVEQVLRAVGRQMSIRDPRKAEEEMHKALEKDRFEDYGVWVTAVRVALSVDSRVLDQAGQLQTLEHQAAVNALQDKSTADTQRRRLEREREALTVYADLIAQGDTKLLALRMVQHPDEVEFIMDRLDASRRQQLALQLEMLNTIMARKGDMLEPEMVQLFNGIATTMTGVTFKGEAPLPRIAVQNEQNLLPNDASTAEGTAPTSSGEPTQETGPSPGAHTTSDPSNGTSGESPELTRAV